MKTKDYSIAFITHTQYRNNLPVYGPSDSFVDYLFKKRTGNIYYLQHSLYKGDGSSLLVSNKGVKNNIAQYTFHKKWMEPLRYLIDILFGIKLLINKEKFAYIIAADPLNFTSALVLKKLNRTKKIVFYTLDYSKQRFSNPILNYCYQFLDRLAARNCDFSISASKAICKERNLQGLKDSKNLYLPNSPILDKITVKSLNQVDRFSLVNVFSNHKQVDFKIMFDSLSKLIIEFPHTKLKLLGKGNFMEDVKPKLNKNLWKYVEFINTKNHAETLNLLSSCGIGLECNTESLAWNAYREPIKIREYFALGMPCISKPGHSLIDEIVNEKLGFVVKNAKDLVIAVSIYFKDEDFYRRSRARILLHSKKTDKVRMLSQVLSKIEV